MQKPSISIIIPTYNKCDELLKPCVESIINYTELNKSIEIIIVANGCVDNTIEFVKTMQLLFPNIFILVNSEKALGYSKAINAGIEKSTGTHIILLNNDTILLPQHRNEWIDKLTAPFLTSEKLVGITGPMKTLSPSAGREFLIFFCVMMSRQLLEELGPLDTSFAEGYGEDTDYCIKAENAGYAIVQVPEEKQEYYDDKRMTGDFPIFHIGNQTFKDYPDENLIHRNNALLKERYNSEKQYISFDEFLFNAHTSINLDKALACDGFMSPTELKWLAETVNNLPSHSTILECGSWHGRSSRAIADHLPENSILICVDTWQGTSGEQDTHHASAKWREGDHAFYEFLQNMNDLVLKGKVVTLRLSSKNASELLKEAKIQLDFCFIDAEHTYEGVKEDLKNWLPLIKEGGIISGHDYFHENNIWPGVQQAVDEIFGHRGKDMGYLFENSIWCHEIHCDSESVIPAVQTTELKDKITMEDINNKNYLSGIYKITNPKGKVYVGKAINIVKRWKQYRNLQCKGQRKLYNSFVKYGVVNHGFEIIELCLENQLDKLEIYYSEILDCLNPKTGLNLIAGGTGGRQSEEVRKKISESNKGKKLSEEHKQAVSNARKGQIPWNKGKTDCYTEEVLAQMSKAKKGKQRSKESIEKHILAMRGRKLSPEHRQILIESNKRRVISEETRKKMSDSRKAVIDRKKLEEEINVIDAFPFNKEFDILERRFSELYDVVDRFVIVEATKTHGNQPKPLYFKDNLDRFAKYLDKVTHIMVDDYPALDSWSIERHQRECIMRGLTQCKDNDVIIISDADEIPYADIIKRVKEEIKITEIRSLQMELYYYNENCRAVDLWYEAKILPYWQLKQLTPCGARYTSALAIPNAGKHLSYFGDIDSVIEKINDTAHQELNLKEFKDPEHIEKCIKNGLDLFNREYIKFEKL